MPTDTAVTGGAGFIGSHLVGRLVESGRRVRVIERPEAPVEHLPLGQVDIVRADIRDRSAVHRALQGCSEVYHLAANPNLWVRPKELFHQVNYLGTVHVLEEALAAGARRILHTSTESILTRDRQTAAISEEQEVTIRDALGPYCRSKFRAERHAFRLAAGGAPVVIVNPTLPIGPGDRGCSPPTRMMLDFCRGRRHEYLDAELNLIDVRDVALGMVRALERGRSGVRYLLGHENRSIYEVFVALGKLTGLPPPHWRVPYPVALAVACVSEFVADVFTGQSPAATVTGVRLTRRRMHFDASRSLAELELQPRPIDQSLADAVDWFRAVGWLGSALPESRASSYIDPAHCPAPGSVLRRWTS
jgi:dihydroflavonol-4-reductase